MVAFLIARKANVHLKNQDGETAILCTRQAISEGPEDDFYNKGDLERAIRVLKRAGARD